MTVMTVFRQWVVAATLGVVAVCVYGEEAKKVEEVRPEEGLKPLLGHVLAPRQAMDLCGEWERVVVPRTRVKVPDPKDATKEVERWDLGVVTNMDTLAWALENVPKAYKGMSDREDWYYRRKVMLPEDVGSKRVVLHFERILDAYDVIVNGKEIAGSWGTFELPWETEITEAVKPGENEIVVRTRNDFNRRVWKDSPFQHLWALEWQWGISRPCHLELLDKEVYIELPKVRTFVAEKTLELRTEVRNATGKEVKGELECWVDKEWRVTVPEVVLPANAMTEICITQKWENVKFWDLEHPNLYKLNVKLRAEGKERDGYTVRFGFREIQCVGHQFMVNGKPYIHRRNGFGGGPTVEGIKADILRVRELGITGKRMFGGDYTRYVAAADEAGAFLTLVSPSGGGAAGKSDAFWETYAGYQARLARCFINSPSVFAYALGNEFGTIYGGNEGGPLEEPTSKKQAELGRRISALDPTRPWTYCGEVDIGYPVKGTVGPAPIRSFHYPIATCKDGVTFPEWGYWYADGRLSWQRISTKDKPLVISEDIYHGTTDQHYGMAKAGGDSIYTVEGYTKTLRYIIRCFVEGHYFAGLGGWETWVTCHDHPDCGLNEEDGLIPNFLIAMRENFPHMTSGKTLVRNVYCYNQLFTKYDCELVREDVFEGKVVARETRMFSLDQGEKHHEEMTLLAPFVKKPTPYQVRFVLRTGERVLAKRTFEYTVFPEVKTLELKRGMAVLASTNSVLRSALPGATCFETVEAALSSGTRALVVDKVLDTAEGRALNDFVIAGGKVLFIEAQEISWAPLMIEFRRPMSFVWRRNDDRMGGLQESWMKTWMPDNTLGDSSYPKPSEDGAVLWDCGQRNGLTNANVLWVNRGKGAWLLCQLPVLSRFAVEPAAPVVLQAVLDEFGANPPRHEGAVVAAEESRAGELLKALKIQTRIQYPSAEDVLVLDASKELDGVEQLALDAHTKAGGTVLLLEPTREANTNLLAKLGLVLKPYEQAQGMLWGSLRNVDRTPAWLARKHSSGLMAGLSSEEFFYADTGRMQSYMTDAYNGKDPWWKHGDNHPCVTGSLELLPGSKAQVGFTEPDGLAVAKYNRGKVVVLTLRLSELSTKSVDRASRLIRTLCNNLGAAMSDPERVHEYQFIDIRRQQNRGLWRDPLYQKEDGSFDPEGWFGNENDMRYFPVNLCGWSLEARNFCPKEAFPTEPLNLGGMKFLLADPAENKGRGCIVLEPGKSVRIPMPKGLKAQKFYFLGAKDGFSSVNLELRIDGAREPILFESGKHYDIYRWMCTPGEGNVAWVGGTLKDDQATLYNWAGINPNPQREVAWIDLKNIGEKDMMAIIAVTAELVDAE